MNGSHENRLTALSVLWKILLVLVQLRIMILRHNFFCVYRFLVIYIIYKLSLISCFPFIKLSQNRFAYAILSGIFLIFLFHFYFKFNADMISSSASPDSLRNKLEEIFKLMLVVWAKEGIALKTISGQKSGRLT